MSKPQVSFETLLIHAGRYESWPEQFPTAPAIIPSTSFRTQSPELLDAILGGEEEGFTYSRNANPTVKEFAEAVRALEGGAVAEAFASGMAALDAALFAVGVTPGDHLLLSQDLYGATTNLSEQLWGSMGIVVETVDVTQLESLDAALRRFQPKALILETISNPLLKVPDLPRVIALAHAAKCQVVVDNTFATPVLLRPLAIGADLVVHSATKYLGGHGDAIGGVVIGTEGYGKRLHQYLKLRGGVLSPFDAWLLHRGLKTLGVRLERQCSNAAQLAQRLADSGRLGGVWYPGLSSHPSREVASRLLSGPRYGAVVTVEIPGGRSRVFRFLSALKVAASATTVGDVYTLCLYPRISSHRNQSAEALQSMGISDDTLRIAVGLESVDDIFSDILSALQASS